MDPTGQRRGRGELESLVLHALWRAEGPLTAKEVAALLPAPTPAHTTVLTALDRLGEKGHVVRVGSGRRHIRFRAARTEEEHVGAAMLARLDSSSDRTGALMHFAEQLDEAALDALRRALGPRRS